MGTKIILLKCPGCGTEMQTTARDLAQGDLKCSVCRGIVPPSAMLIDDKSIETGKQVSAIAILLLDVMAMVHTSMIYLKNGGQEFDKKLVEAYQAQCVNEAYAIVGEIMQIVPEKTIKEVQTKWVESIQRFEKEKKSWDG